MYSSTFSHIHLISPVDYVCVFQLQSGWASLGKNMPSVAGNLKWSQELRNRIFTNRSNVCQLAYMYGCIRHDQCSDLIFQVTHVFSLYTVKKSHSNLPLDLPIRSLGCAEAEDVFRKCEHVLEVLDHHDEELFSEWTEGLEEICQTHLKEPLLTLDSDQGLFQVNFSPAVSTNQVSNIFRFVLKEKERNRGKYCDRCLSLQVKCRGLVSSTVSALDEKIMMNNK